MKARLAAVAALILLTGLALAQPPDEEQIVIEEPADDRLAGDAALQALALPPLQLGADLGNSCICLCRQAEAPNTEAWGYYERSIVNACRWSGRICVIDGTLGTLGACAESPAPLG